MATLPSKRSPNSPPDGTTSPKKSKAELKRQSLSKAQQWAAERKRKQEGEDDDDAKKHKQDEGEKRDVLENLPTSPARSARSTRSRRSTRGGGDDASHTSEITESSIGSRRSTRRRTMTVKAASAASSSTARSTGRGRKSVAPIEEEPEAAKINKIPEREEEPAADDVVEGKVPTPKKATPKKKPTPKKETIATEEAAPESQSGEMPSDMNIRLFIPSFSVFLYTIFLQWSIVFAAVLVFFLDWFAFEFHPDGANAEYSSQRTSSAILGLWLVTIAGYSIVLGPHSMAGWILATSSLTMANFAIKMNWGESYDVALPSVPIYSVSSIDITILDVLVAVGFAGWLVLYFKVPEQPVATRNENSGAAVDEVGVTNEVHTPSNDENTGPYSFIGGRVAVDKSGVVYTGTVSNYDAETRRWTVTYKASEGLGDDELNRLEIASAFKLYSKEMSDRLKAMWRANEI